jgi:hypothetical protein
MGSMRSRILRGNQYLTLPIAMVSAVILLPLLGRRGLR